MSAKPHLYLVTGTTNEAYVDATQELRRSGAAGKHLNKADKRARSRSAALERAVKRSLDED